MKCKCGLEMKYFKDWEKDIDGYRCECGAEKIIKAIEIEEPIKELEYTEGG